MHSVLYILWRGGAVNLVQLDTWIQFLLCDFIINLPREVEAVSFQCVTLTYDIVR